MAGLNPVAKSHASPPPAVSSTTYNIAGITVTVHGLSELTASSPPAVAVLWLLHPRLQTAATMAPLASTVLSAWLSHPSSAKLGLVAASFDQRNHGARQATALANEAWVQGNPTHAPDMFGQFAGTARDAALLVDLLPAYAFPPPSRTRVAHHAALGVSLGGHCAWHALLHIPDVRTAVAVIGCPDYAGLMADRARLSKRPSYAATTPPGAAFFGSVDFPPALVESVRRLDPRGLLVGDLPPPGGEERVHATPEQERGAAQILRQKLGGKSMLCLSGGSDKLVPPARGKPFMDWLKAGLVDGGWAAGAGFELQDIIFDGVGHEMPPPMVAEATRFLVRDLDRVAAALDGKSRM